MKKELIVDDMDGLIWEVKYDVVGDTEKNVAGYVVMITLVKYLELKDVVMRQHACIRAFLLPPHAGNVVCL